MYTKNETNKKKYIVFCTHMYMYEGTHCTCFIEARKSWLPKTFPYIDRYFSPTSFVATKTFDHWFLLHYEGIDVFLPKK